MTAQIDRKTPTTDLAALHRKSQTVLSRIRREAMTNHGQKEGPTFTLARAAELVHRSPDSIRTFEKDGRLPKRPPDKQRHAAYTLKDLNHMREVFETKPWRAPGDEPAIISVANFKGGVGKSTIAQHLSQYFAMKGYRVLVIDCDSQASTTLMFGYIPDIDLTEQDTLYAYFHEPDLGVEYLIRKTHFDGLDLIPANLKLYNLEYEIAAHLARSRSFDIIDSLSDAIELVKDNYDIIILDPPPALGMVSMAALQAANSMVIPIPPSLMDFASTASFLDMARSTMEALEKVGARSKPAYKWIKLAPSRVDENAITHQFKEIMTAVYGDSMLKASLVASAAIGNANAQLKTVYEMDRSSTSPRTLARILDHLESVFSEIEQCVLDSWSSKARRDD